MNEDQTNAGGRDARWGAPVRGPTWLKTFQVCWWETVQSAGPIRSVLNQSRLFGSVGCVDMELCRIMQPGRVIVHIEEETGSGLCAESCWWRGLVPEASNR
ncbi:hypothetical protein XENOCAPTIV_001264 [Xenoophorus captivus]|uniref:Uncharacterized protein n=1 Tax=Xenoophorus captivus TaxID=1517983 RepID=A0ABV0QTX4_9TELE